MDYNSTLAGQALTLEVEVVSLTKPSQYRNRKIEWIEDYESGLKVARRNGKPAVLVLYAAWCGYSTRLLEESIPDPKIRLLDDSFVWMKIDSHEKREYKELYEQTSYPWIVVLNPEGEVVKTIRGFKPADQLRQELTAVITDRLQLAGR
mgnify:CR=1 FL=1